MRCRPGGTLGLSPSDLFLMSTLDHAAAEASVSPSPPKVAKTTGKGGRHRNLPESLREGFFPGNRCAAWCSTPLVVAEPSALSSSPSRSPLPVSCEQLCTCSIAHRCGARSLRRSQHGNLVRTAGQDRPHPRRATATHARHRLALSIRALHVDDVLPSRDASSMSCYLSRH